MINPTHLWYTRITVRFQRAGNSSIYPWQTPWQCTSKLLELLLCPQAQYNRRYTREVVIASIVEASLGINVDSKVTILSNDQPHACGIDRNYQVHTRIAVRFHRGCSPSIHHGKPPWQLASNRLLLLLYPKRQYDSYYKHEVGIVRIVTIASKRQCILA